MNRIRRSIAGTTVAALLTVGAVTLAAAPAQAGNRIEPERTVSRSEAIPLPTDSLLGNLGLGGIADTVCDLLHGLLGTAKGSGDSSGLGLPELPVDVP